MNPVLMVLGKHFCLCNILLTTRMLNCNSKFSKQSIKDYLIILPTCESPRVTSCQVSCTYKFLLLFHIVRLF